MTGHPLQTEGRLALRFAPEPAAYWLSIAPDNRPAVAVPWPTDDLTTPGDVALLLEQIADQLDGSAELTAAEVLAVVGWAAGYDADALDRDAASFDRFGEPGQFG